MNHGLCSWCLLYLLLAFVFSVWTVSRLVGSLPLSVPSSFICAAEILTSPNLIPLPLTNADSISVVFESGVDLQLPSKEITETSRY